MRMILHCVSDNIGDLIESAIILLRQSMQDPALDRLQSIFELGNRPIPDYIGGVLEEIFIDEILQGILGQME